MQDLLELRQELKELNSKLTQSELLFKVENASKSEKHDALLEKFERLENKITTLENDMKVEIETISSSVDKLRELAIQGETSLKVLWVIGAFVTGCLAILASWIQVIK